MAPKPSPIPTVDDEGPSVAKAARPSSVPDHAAGSDAEPVLAPDPPPEALPPVLTAEELAALLRVNRKTVYAAFQAGRLPGGQRIGGAIRFSRDAVLRWLAEGQVSRSSRGSR